MGDRHSCSTPLPLLNLGLGLQSPFLTLYRVRSQRTLTARACPRPCPTTNPPSTPHPHNSSFTTTTLTVPIRHATLVRVLISFFFSRVGIAVTSPLLPVVLVASVCFTVVVFPLVVYTTPLSCIGNNPDSPYRKKRGLFWPSKHKRERDKLAC